MYWLYSLITATAAILLAPYWIIHAFRRGHSLRTLRERFGFYRRAPGRRPTAPSIWIHAVSVGEVLVAAPLVRQLRQRLPQFRYVVSTTTVAGYTMARERIDGADALLYFPLDWNGPVRRAFRAVCPALIVIMETEIWPNFLRYAGRAGVPVVFANGRLSADSERGYLRVDRWMGGLIRRSLGGPAAFLMQSREAADRVIRLGAPEDRVEVTGNLKYDLEPPKAGFFKSWLERQIHEQGRGPVIVAGSLLADEAAVVLSAFDSVVRRWPRALLLLAPRKPEQFDDMANGLAQDGWKFVRRSRMGLDARLGDDVDLILLDSLGELAGLYELADAAFVGGSFVPAGGHNILEPASCSQPPVFGPHMENFPEITRTFLAAQAAIQVDSAASLARAWEELLEDRERRERMGRAARELVDRNRGATHRTVSRILALLEHTLGPREASLPQARRSEK